jgi:hypothetical protein
VAFQVLVRDVNGNPLINSTVAIDLCGCAGVHLCPMTTTDPYSRPNACTVSRVTDAAGRVEFRIRAGGVCSGLGARIFADGVFLASRNVASPDQDGNLIVQNPDHALAVSKLGSADPTADFDCDGTVKQSDADYLAPHSGHACPPVDPTPVSRRTWGVLKTIYR